MKRKIIVAAIVAATLAGTGVAVASIGSGGVVGISYGNLQSGAWNLNVTEVSATSTQVAGFSGNRALASCPAGELVVGGGHSQSNPSDAPPISSIPNYYAAGWDVTWYGMRAGDTGTAYVLCLN